MTGDIRSSWVDVTNAAGPILLRLGRATEMAVFWSCFRDFVGAQKIEDLSESKIFFRRSISNKKKKILFTKKKTFLGVRCTSRRALNPRGFVNSARVRKANTLQQ